MDSSIQVTPSIRVLSPEAIDQIHHTSLKILSEIGIRVDSGNAITVFKSAPGVKFIDEQHLVISPDTVNSAIRQSSETIDIYNRLGERVIHLGDDQTRFGIGVTNLFYQDPVTDAILPFTREHMRSSVGLGNQLPSFDVISTIGIIRDVDIHKADLVAILEMVANTTKPLILLITDEKQFRPGLVFLEKLAGERSAKPWVIPYFNPVSPLIINQSTADNMLFAVESGIPVIFSNYGMAGLSTPISSAGTLALLNAELLAGLVYCQLIKPGAPIILGSLPAFFDMKTMVDFYDPQTMLLNLACAEMMAYYHIPHAGTSGSSNGYGPDLIASVALCINQLTSCIGKAGLAPFVGGSFGSKVFSPNLVVFANDMIEGARQFAKDFIIDEDNLSFNDLKTLGAGGNFITSRQTSRLFRTAYHNSTVFPHLSLEGWQEAGQPDALKLVRRRTLELLNTPKFPEDQSELLTKGEYLISHPEFLSG